MQATRSHRSTYISWVVLAGVLALGLAITRHYGESWDERQFFKYADRALQAYSTWPRTGSIPLTGNTYDNYGPAFVMLSALGARALAYVLPWSVSDLRHLVYFASFVVGMWAFHRLARRWLSPAAAVGATLLLATQPVIWGHAFISPKDVPFLTGMVLSLHLGFQMVDHLKAQVLPRGVAPRLLWITGAWLALLLLLIIAAPWFRSLIENLVHAAAVGQPNIISSLASDVATADPAIYVGKAFVWLLRLRAIAIVLSTVAVAVLWRRVPGAYRLLATVAPAGIVLGLTTSIRILGPLAAILVAAYAIRELRSRSIPVLIPYTLLALIGMYSTWPYLWPDPVGHLLESIRVMSQYPWRGSVLFDGALYPSTALPFSYLPVLLSIQLTETALLAIAAGLIIAIIATKQKDRSVRDLLVAAAVWCGAPLAVFIITRAPLYDNFRQVLFLLPPLFLLAGLTLDRIKNLPIRAAVMAVLILPGIVGGARLHPYEYMFYNRLVGGVQGAFRRFELDYWGTSFREAAAYLDQVAPANASVWVEGPTHLLQAYARPDLKIFSTYEPERADHYDYVVALTRFNLDLSSYPDAAINHVIERQGAILTVIKKP